MSILLNPELRLARNALASKPPHLTVMLDGVAASFADKANPLSLHNTATNLRELLREVLGQLSTDAEIKACSWFVPDPSSATGVTRRHRVQFAIYRYLDPTHFKLSLVDDIEGIADDLVESVEVFSPLTHITDTTISPNRAATVGQFKKALGLFHRLATAIQEGRDHITDELQSFLAKSLTELFTQDFFDALDQLSTHTRPQDADHVEVTVTGIVADGVHFTGSGRVNCDLQHGSDGDCRRGDGVEGQDSFPFTFANVASLDTPFRAKITPRDIVIDTSSYYGDPD